MEDKKYPNTSRRKRYEKQRVSLENERSSFIPLYRDIGDFIRPQRVRLQTSDRNRGDRRNLKIIDNTATIASRTLRSGMMSGITSPAMPWFKLTTQDTDLSEFASVKDWLHTVTERMRTVYLASNYYNVKPIVYGDMGDFATAAYFMEKDAEEIIRCYPMAIGSYCIANDHRRKVNTFFREFSMTVQQIVHRFGHMDDNGRPDWSNISMHVKKMYEEGHYQEWIDVCHIVQPNEMYTKGMKFAKYKRFSSCYYEKGTGSKGSNYMSGSGDQDKMLEEKGYDYFPVLCPRWETSGEDVYGTSSPGIDCIGDVKQLQTMEKRSAQAIELLIKPPMKGPTSLRSAKSSIVPGDITFLDVQQGQQGFEPVYEINPRLNEFEAKAAQVRGRVNTTYFADLFLMLQNLERSGITAREIDERHAEKLLALGPVLEQLNQDDLDPGIDITFLNMMELGQIPPPPEEMRGQQVKVEYVSYMHQAQKAMGLAGMDRFLGYATSVMQLDPQAGDKINFDELIDIYGEITGIPPKAVRSDDETKGIRANRAQQQQAQSAAMAMQQAAVTAKDLSQTPMDGDSALTRLVDQGQSGSLAPTAV